MFFFLTLINVNERAIHAEYIIIIKITRQCFRKNIIFLLCYPNATVRLNIIRKYPRAIKQSLKPQVTKPLVWNEIPLGCFGIIAPQCKCFKNIFYELFFVHVKKKRFLISFWGFAQHVVSTERCSTFDWSVCVCDWVCVHVFAAKVATLREWVISKANSMLRPCSFSLADNSRLCNERLE